MPTVYLNKTEGGGNAPSITLYTLWGGGVLDTARSGRYRIRRRRVRSSASSVSWSHGLVVVFSSAIDAEHYIGRHARALSRGGSLPVPVPTTIEQLLADGDHTIRFRDWEVRTPYLLQLIERGRAAVPSFAIQCVGRPGEWTTAMIETHRSIRNLVIASGRAA